MGNISAYYRCQNCRQLKQVVVRLRKYCSRKCRDASYYKRKKRESLLKEIPQGHS